MRKNKPREALPESVQQSIPFDRMWKDGICRVSEGYYTKTIAFEDINYQLATLGDKKSILEDWSSFLNFFDSSIHFELSFVNTVTDKKQFLKRIRIEPANDGFDDLRKEYNQMLTDQYKKGNNGITRTKYLTFGIHADSVKQALPRIIHVQNDLINNFRQMGVYAYVLNGVERLEVMHDMFHLCDDHRFQFDWKMQKESGLSVKDFIAPESLDFGRKRTFEMGDLHCAVSSLAITASQIPDNMLKEFLDLETGQIVTMHIRSIDQNVAVKMVKRTITELDRSKIEEQKKAVRAGYDMDIIPSDLATYGRDAKSLLDQLQSQDQRLFLVTFLLLTTGHTKQELDNNILQVKSIAQKHSCNITRLDYEQEQGLVSSLPLAQNAIEVERALTTSAAAIFVPFTTQELFQKSDEAIYSGLNAVTGNMIYLDRKQLKAPNGLILGTPGSGKSFTTKREIYSVFLSTPDDIIICDPEAEYAALTESLKGQVIRVSPVSHQHINPMDINENYSDDDEPIKLKSDFILSFCELILDNENGLGYRARSVIDRAVRTVYERYFRNPSPENMPILQDLYEELLAQGDPDSKDIAAGLEIYVTGSLSVFNHRTNVDINQRVVCYDIKDLGKQLKKLGMLIVQDQVWNRVTVNRYQQKTTRYYIDEFHLLLREEQTAAYSIEIWKRFRKWGGIPTGITQNVKDLLASREVENIFENSEYICMLNQAAGDREILAQHLGISPHQLRFVTRVGEGQGLIFYGSMVMPFVDHFPKDTKMYQIMTTKLLETVPQAESEDSETELTEEKPTCENTVKAEASDAVGSEAVPDDGVPREEKPASEKKKMTSTKAKTKKTLAKSTAKAPAKSTSKSTAKETLKKAETIKKPEIRTAKPKTAPAKDLDAAFLKAVSDLLPRKGMEWSGTATELMDQLAAFDLSPNIATRKLNENAAKLLSDHGISYGRIRNHSGRIIKLTRVEAKSRRKKKEGDSL